MTFRRRAHRSEFRLDAESLDSLYRELAPQMLAYFARRLRDRDAAVDLLAETFARAFEKRASFRGVSEVDAEHWIWGIARNVLLTTIRDAVMRREATRRLGIERRALTDEEYERIDEMASSTEQNEAVRAALSYLSGDQRDALELRIVQQLGYDEIASRLQVSRQTARARVSRGLRTLSSRLRTSDPGAE